MNTGGYFATFVWGVLVGMGGHIGWGLITLVVDMLQKSLGK